MIAFALYSVFVSVSLTLLWSVWRLTGLGRCTYFSFSRHTLTGIMVFSLTVALVPFVATYYGDSILSVGHAYDGMDGANVLIKSPNATLLPTSDESVMSAASALLVKALVAIYYIGLVISLARLLFSLTDVLATICRSRRVDGEAADLGVVDDENQQSFSWGGRIVMSRKDWTCHGSIVLAHERVHSGKHHWVELLLANVVKCLTWYCPAIYFIIRDLIAQQEYEADAAVRDNGYDLNEYMMLLIEKAGGRRFANFVANGINTPYYSLKNRISMMKQKKSDKRGRVRVLYALPIAALIAIMAMIPSVVAVAQDALTINDEVVDGRVAIPSLSDKDVMQLSRKIIYPAEMQESKTQGSVAVKITVKEDGTIASANVLTSSGQKQLDDAVLTGLAGVVITPGTYDGVPAEMDCILRVTFKSQSSSEPIAIEKTFPAWEMDELLIMGA